MTILFFDTETTGLPLWREPSDHPDQPNTGEKTGGIRKVRGGAAEQVFAPLLRGFHVIDGDRSDDNKWHNNLWC